MKERRLMNCVVPGRMKAEEAVFSDEQLSKRADGSLGTKIASTFYRYSGADKNCAPQEELTCYGQSMRGQETRP